jgi:hypothetical protein
MPLPMERSITGKASATARCAASAWPAATAILARFRLDRNFPWAARFRAVRLSVRRRSLMDDLMIGIYTTPFDEHIPQRSGTAQNPTFLEESWREVKGFLVRRERRVAHD